MTCPLNVQIVLDRRQCSVHEKVIFDNERKAAGENFSFSMEVSGGRMSWDRGASG